MIILYHILITILSPLIFIIFLFVLLFSKRIRYCYYQRLGFGNSLNSKKRVWVHAASLGEVNAISGFICNLDEKDLIISTLTDTGLMRIKSLFPGAISFILPLDIWFILVRMIRIAAAEKVIIAETELWPAFIHLIAKSNAKVHLINGRISNKSYKKYMLFRNFIKPVLNRFNMIIAQSEIDKQRFVSLGYKGNIKVMPSTKFCIKAEIPGNDKIAVIKKNLRIKRNEYIFVCGSVRTDEEKFILDFYQGIKSDFKLKIIIVPRHLDYNSKIIEEVLNRGYKYILESELNKKGFTGNESDILIVDSMGRLLDYYAAADISFIGGTIAPIGGHNPIEAAYAGSPVIFGPNISNNPELFQFLLNKGTGFLVKDHIEMIEVFKKYHREFSVLGEKAKKYVKEMGDSISNIQKEIGL